MTPNQEWSRSHLDILNGIIGIPNTNAEKLTIYMEKKRTLAKVSSNMRMFVRDSARTDT